MLDYTVPFALTPKQFHAVKKAFDNVKAKGDVKSFYTPRAMITPPFLKSAVMPVFGNSVVKVYGIARKTPEFEGECYSVLFDKTEDCKKKLSIRFDMQCFSNFVGFGGLDLAITRPDGAIENFWLPTVEHVFQFVKTLTVSSDDALLAMENVVGAKKPVEAKKATAEGKLDVESGRWFEFAKGVMMVLPSFNLKNRPFFDLMSEVLDYAKSNGVDPKDVVFVEANSDKHYGSGVTKPTKEQSLTLSDEDYIKWNNPDLVDEGCVFPGANTLGLALGKAFEAVVECGGDYSKLVVGDIMFLTNPEEKEEVAAAVAPLGRSLSVMEEGEVEAESKRQRTESEPEPSLHTAPPPSGRSMSRSMSVAGRTPSYRG